MKKLILSSVALLGLFGAVVAPAQAQVLVNSTPTGGSLTGAASFTNINGSTSAIAGEITFPGTTYAPGVTVTSGTPSGNVGAGSFILGPLKVENSGAIVADTTAAGTKVEAAVATLITNSTVLNEKVSYIRAWTSGGLN